MQSFHWMTVTLSMILGLGVTGLLTAGVGLFRARGAVRMAWIPVVWAACIFINQLQFWWAIIELSSVDKAWSIVEFLVLLGLVLLLYVASALVLPPPISLKQGDRLTATFQRDGRWALVFLSLYFSLAILANWYLWNVPLFSYLEVLDLGLVVLPIVYLTVRASGWRATVTVLYACLCLWSAWAGSPKSY